MRIFFFVCAGLFLLLTGEAAAENTVMSRRTLDRANLFKSGDLSFSVSTDEHSPSFWSATVVKQKEERRVPINRSGVTLIFFPDEVLEVRNNRLPGRERWNIMQETIGEFEVIRRRPAEFFKPAPVQMTQEKSKDRSICVFQNGTFTLRLLPSLNGALYSMIDSVTGVEFFYGNPSGGVGKNAFEKLGFLELINRPRNASATAGVEFQPQLKKFPSGGGILKIEKEIPDSGAVKLSRTMELAPGLPQLKIRTSFISSGQAVNAFGIRHRPEATYVGASNNRAISIFTEENGIWQERLSPNGEVIPKGSRYAMVDRAHGFLFGIAYDPENLKQLYLWNAANYVTLEAWGPMRTLETPLSLGVRYFLIRGMSKVNFLGSDGALYLEDTQPVIHAGKEWTPTFLYGTASQWKNLNISFTIKNSKGETVLTEKYPLPSPVPGFAAAPARPVLNTAKLVPGKYDVTFVFSEGDIKGKLSVTIVSSTQLKEFQSLLDRIRARIAEQRKNYKNLPPSKKRQALREFKRNLKLRDACEEALKKGDVKVLGQLLQEFR